MKKQISSDAYDKTYFLSNSVEGYQEYMNGSLSHMKKKLLDMLSVNKGSRCLEVGVGRGEFLRHCAIIGAKVTGIDYSGDAIDITREALRDFPDANIQIADARSLPFDSDSFDRVFAGDVIEHLSFEDGVLMLKEMYRVLRPGGFMLIHTSPNTIFTRIVYPLIRQMIRFISRETANSLENHLKTGDEFHVHEYNVFSLKRVAGKAGLTNFKVWIDKDILRSGQHRLTQKLKKNPLVLFAAYCGKLSVVRFWIGNDLYLECSK